MGDKAIETKGWQIVFLIRLSPVLPFNVMNYALALTGVKFWHYALASWIGMLPGTILYVYIGGSINDLSQIISGNYNGGLKTKIFFYVGLGVAVLVVVIVTIIAKKAINKALKEAEQEIKNEKGEDDTLADPSTSQSPNSDTDPLLSKTVQQTYTPSISSSPPTYEKSTVPPSYYDQSSAPSSYNQHGSNEHLYSQYTNNNNTNNNNNTATSHNINSMYSHNNSQI